ncbi:phycobilisome rod-core linker polypeptide [Candidatus Methylocalor cossyra]|uniref:PBS-linker domain-containing protein n=1 Tax=Candidatus Methylocalor cossyra TaxID=3108543 RepID=A0ABM9NIU4_9GAMM
MAKKLSFNVATRVAGQLYGNILQRNADPAGFDWCVEVLTNGTLSVREIVKVLCKSDEYREKFLMNDTPNEIARKFRKKFFGEANPRPEDIKETALLFLEMNWRDAMDQLLDSPEYYAKYGDDGIPR